ncbi:hypothetical protein O9993_08575 [Vibrio lentus]|nr:hypothetical protein [Vibrio lentus]
MYGISSFLVGIDFLGTTNTVVAYCEINDDLQHAPVSLSILTNSSAPVKRVLGKPLLPSFRYHPAQGQISLPISLMPWEPSLVEGDIQNVIVGEWARELGAKVSAAKYPVLRAGYLTKRLIVTPIFCLGQAQLTSIRSLLLSQAQLPEPHPAKHGTTATQAISLKTKTLW